MQRISCFLCILFVTGGVASAQSKTVAKPNMIFVMADDLAWADVGFNGASFYETPHIDAMARAGMVLNRFYPGGPNCAPTRACIVTGMYTPRHQLYQPSGKGSGDVTKMRWKVPTRRQGKDYETFQSNNDHIAAKWISIAEVVKAAGYKTARIGKWHLGEDDQGFDLSTNDGRHPFSDVSKSFYGDVDVAEQLTDRTLAFIEDNRDRPFMIYLNHWEVHGPMKARKRIVAKYERKKQQGLTDKSFDWKPIYAAEVEAVDRSVGCIRNKLSQLGIEDNTLLVFTSDNGGAAQFTANFPLRGCKGGLFEGGIRTACVAVWPDVIEAGSRSEVPVTGVDMMPTFAELAGAALPKTQPVDGVSIVPVLRQEPIGDRAIFWHYPLYLSGTGYGKSLPIYNTDKLYWRGVPSSAIMQGNWKLIHYYEYEKSRLFHLGEDPAETNDRLSTNPQRAAELEAKLIAWVLQTGAPVPNTLNPAFGK